MKELNKSKLIATGRTLIVPVALLAAGFAVTGIGGPIGPSVDTRAATLITSLGPGTGYSMQKTISGEWSGEIAEFGGDPVIKLYVRTPSNRGGIIGTRNVIPIREAIGLQPGISTEELVNAEFKLVRDAGTIAFVGEFRKGKGNGTWTLSPDPAFQAAMARRGYANLKESELFLATTENVTEKYIDDLRSAGFENLTFGQLAEAAGIGVTLDFVTRVRSRGYPNATFKELVQLRVHDIMQ